MPKDGRAKRRGRQGKKLGEVPGALQTEVAEETSPSSQAPRGPAPPQPAAARVPSRLALHPSAPGGRPPHVPGSPVARLGGGLARPPRRAPLSSSPSWRGGGAEGGVGGARRGRGSPPLPRLRVRARPRLCQASGARSGPVTSCRAERVGAAGRGLRAGLEEGAGGEVLPGQLDPSPVPPLPSAPSSPSSLPRVPRFLPAPVAMTTPLPGLCAPGPGVGFLLGFFFPPRLSLSFSSFFPFFLSEFCTPVGGTKLRKCWPLVGTSLSPRRCEKGGK